MLLLQKENQVNQVIPDAGGLKNAIKVHHAGRVESIKVGVKINHPYVGDLKVSLIAPSGNSINLHNRSGGSTDNIDTVYEGDAVKGFAGESINGEWTLDCQDFAPRDEGSLVSWNIEAKCALAEERSEIVIPDGEDGWLISEQEAKSAGIIQEGTVIVHIQHPYQGDLIVKVKSPDGEEVMLHNREGGSTNNLEKTYSLDAFKGKNTLGIWTLMIKDEAPRDSGTLKYWKIGFKYQKINDLTTIEGVNSAAAAALNSNGVYSYSRLSTLGTAKLRTMLSEVDGVGDVNGILDGAKAVA